MSTAYRVALLGFSAFERGTLASYFRLASKRQPHYELVPLLHDADFVLADADHGPSTQLVDITGCQRETLYVGHNRPAADGAAFLGRPIDPMSVMHALDALAAREGEDAATATGATQPRQRTVFRLVRSPRAQPAAPPPDSAEGLLPPAPEPMDPARPEPLPEAAAPTVAAALLVDIGPDELRDLRAKLARYGLHTEISTDGRRALERLRERAFDVVFVEIELGRGGELDGLTLCQRIKRRGATAVVMVSANHNEMDRVRTALAGCDAYLAKPVDDAELARTLARLGIVPREQPGWARA